MGDRIPSCASTTDKVEAFVISRGAEPLPRSGPQATSEPATTRPAGPGAQLPAGTGCDMTDDNGMVIARVVITRFLQDADIVDHVIAATEDGNELGLAEALGMMRLAEDTLIRSRQDVEQ